MKVIGNSRHMIDTSRDTEMLIIPLTNSIKAPSGSCGIMLACVASVSSRVIARKLEREQKKNGRGRGRGEEETLARKPHDSGKRPLIFHGSVHL